MIGKSLLGIAVAAAALTLSVPGDARAAVLVTNGSFENFTGGSPTGTPSQLGDSGTGGYTALTGWTVGPGSSGELGFLMAPGSADTTGSYSPRLAGQFFLWGSNNGGLDVIPASSPDGGNFVALDGAADFRGAGISQTITGLTVGQLYEVSFYWGAGQQKGQFGDTQEQLQVTFGSDVKTTSVFNLGSQRFSGWMAESFRFTASSASQVLNFLAMGSPNNLPPIAVLDGVSITAVPEPSTLSTVFLMGLCGVAAEMRRRRSQAA